MTTMMARTVRTGVKATTPRETMMRVSDHNHNKGNHGKGNHNEGDHNHAKSDHNEGDHNHAKSDHNEGKATTMRARQPGTL